MKKRTLSSVVLLTLSYLILHFSHYWLGSVLFLFVVLAINGIALYEFYCIVEKKGSTSFMICGIVIGLGYAIVEFSRAANPIWIMPELPFTFVAFIALTTIFVLQLLYRVPVSPLYNFSMTMAGLIYVTWLFCFILKINYYPIYPIAKTVSGSGSIFLLFAIAVTKGADSFAYLVGTFFGKHRLAPAISPNKTIEGAIGAVVGGVLIGVIFRLLASFPVEVSMTEVCVMAFTISAVAQFGDLVESMLKRDARIKDSGGKLPGLGGILDLIDSLLFTLPTTYFFMRLWVVK